MSMRRITGEYATTRFGDEEVRAFVPYALPPTEPTLVFSSALVARLQAAEQALRRLELAGEMVPSLDYFIYAFVRKEAVLSSQIEGTQATLVDLLEFESRGDDAPVPGADLEEICNYLDALKFARAQLVDPKAPPLSMRLLGATHERLMQSVRGGDKFPGQVRTTQNWIGGSRPGNAAYVPPPPSLLAELLSDFDKYIHASDDTPMLVRAGMLHVQFETIHPYLDGNGRIGRLLVTLLLEHWGLLPRPLLYLSVFLKRHKSEYYRRLSAVRSEGAWEEWLDFFLDGVSTVADESVASAKDLNRCVSEDHTRLLGLSDVSVGALRLFYKLPEHPVVTIARAVQLCHLTKPTAARAIGQLCDTGILHETTGRQRDRMFAYTRYLDVLRVGTELG